MGFALRFGAIAVVSWRYLFTLAIISSTLITLLAAAAWQFGDDARGPPARSSLCTLIQITGEADPIEISLRPRRRDRCGAVDASAHKGQFLHRRAAAFS